MNLYGFLRSMALPTSRDRLAVVVFSYVGLGSDLEFNSAVRSFTFGWLGRPLLMSSGSTEPLQRGGLVIYAGVFAAPELATLLRPIVIEGVLAEVVTILLLGGSILVLVGFIDDYDTPLGSLTLTQSGTFANR